ncbi:hypothetical protein EXM63_02450 [Clostridium botulinum]|uniref:Uncharacterized protein n=1 Tax=Clostridium botulinum TaxID=1491 RepID=A0A6M0SX44_CLOBO|nr:hypothetical protein [Clostridium botulinum]NFI74348.1 hypothetical protein [Clostridium sporogenes]NFP62256.1 hypothetical protein [Clostridium sporogenes]NFU95592.1 hypothetical protein [Clostridium sporogenes]NFV67925.1 hypothetical protein [Clostridium botulinum]
MKIINIIKHIINGKKASKSEIKISLEAKKILKESLIEKIVLEYLEEEKININMINNVNFLNLVIDRIYKQEMIYILEDDLEENLFTGTSPDERQEFYLYSTEEKKKIEEDFDKMQEEKEKKLKRCIKELKEMDNRLNSFLV